MDAKIKEENSPFFWRNQMKLRTEDQFIKKCTNLILNYQLIMLSLEKIKMDITNEYSEKKKRNI